MCAVPNTGLWALRGTVSFGETECINNFRPNIYSDIDFYRVWIETAIVDS